MTWPDVPRAVSRLHELVTWCLAATQSIETESRAAADVAAHLAGMLGEVERINAALVIGYRRCDMAAY